MTLPALLGSDFELNAPLPVAEYARQSHLLTKPVPKEYLAFMQQHNGGEGPIGPEGYLALFSLEELVDWNTDWETNRGPLDCTIFASDRGNTVYAFNLTGEIVEFDMIGYSPEEALPVAPDFSGFLASFS
ncbi:hypothetical protein E4631_24405 [Hymenobacter sp. UV11]|uniref:SMI1/KNR4 family protein n=1 Tax=Hymenobacter sp. UV11 TaxID=1849735 RepID=UPI00105B7232|nr:SMI1/KNR4 family protein [Hymenobacter sp. UV11]TDN35738.1 hypothetical protein A8B98_12515 [Hymenobacter sp. UV11]TFZ62778.1 hypothetical protein E4631_24405 [Hymenobacter sp. UV11]